VIGSVRDWWHSGEEGATRVYRMGFRRPGAALLIGTALGALFLALKPGAWPGAALGWTLGALRLLAEARRAVIFNRDAIKYRPPFGPPQATQIGDIREVTKGRILVSFGWRPRPKEGAKLVLRDGRVVGVPLNLPEADRILGHMQDVIPRDKSSTRI
jgi:hypothetical protein